jgi:RNA polymerase sigma-70 factor (ECF subfamily)
LTVRAARPHERLVEPKAMSMSAGRNRPPLTLVTSSAPKHTASDGRGDARSAGGEADWSRLMALAQDGDRQSYRRLLEDITPFLRSLAVRCFKQQGDIEDAVQDVLLTVHAIRHTYDPNRPFGPWLVAITNRRIIDRLRREMRARSREMALTAAPETFLAYPANLQADVLTNPADTLADEAALRDAIAHLPPDQRQAVTLVKLKEMSLKEAAAASGRSVAALKVATHRAIKGLRNMLRQKSETP